MCEECQKTMRKTQLVAAGAGLVLGGAIAFAAFKFLSK